MGLVYTCERCQGETRPFDGIQEQPCRACLVKEVQSLRREVIEQVRERMAVALLGGRNEEARRAELELKQRIAEAAEPAKGESDG